MKKLLVFLLLFIVACGGNSQEAVVEDTTTTTLQDTTTTTIPPAPTIDFNIVEIYNKKLGTELCSDAKEIDTTSEECLRQYKENLNYLITLQNEIGDFASDLIAYYEIYPDLVNQEYEDYINFIENEYSQVFTTVSDVENKYIERFGGEPELLNLDFLNKDELGVGCKAEIDYTLTENTKKAEIIFENNLGEEIKLNLSNETENYRSLNIVNSGGLFTVKSAIFTNYLGENFSKNIDSEFFVKFNHIKISKVYFDKEKVSPGESFKIYFEWENPDNLDFFSANKSYDSAIIIFLRDENSSNGLSIAYSDNLKQEYKAGDWDYFNKVGYVEFHLDAVRNTYASGQQDSGRRSWIIGPEGKYFIESIHVTMNEHLKDYSYLFYSLMYNFEYPGGEIYTSENLSICDNDNLVDKVKIISMQDSITFEK